jgi:hypothetical protein
VRATKRPSPSCSVVIMHRSSGWRCPTFGIERSQRMSSRTHGSPSSAASTSSKNAARCGRGSFASSSIRRSPGPSPSVGPCRFRPSARRSTPTGRPSRRIPRQPARRPDAPMGAPPEQLGRYTGGASRLGRDAPPDLRRHRRSPAAATPGHHPARCRGLALGRGLRPPEGIRGEPACPAPPRSSGGPERGRVLPRSLVTVMGSYARGPEPGLAR